MFSIWSRLLYHPRDEEKEHRERLLPLFLTSSIVVIWIPKDEQLCFHLFLMLENVIWYCRTDYQFVHTKEELALFALYYKRLDFGQKKYIEFQWNQKILITTKFKCWINYDYIFGFTVSISIMLFWCRPLLSLWWNKNPIRYYEEHTSSTKWKIIAFRKYLNDTKNSHRMTRSITIPFTIRLFKMSWFYLLHDYIELIFIWY